MFSMAPIYAPLSSPIQLLTLLSNSILHSTDTFQAVQYNRCYSSFYSVNYDIISLYTKHTVGSHDAFNQFN